MTQQIISIMRHELLLVAVLLIVLMAEIFWNPATKKNIRIFSIILFGIITLIGFLPSPSGSLFGDMYVVTPIRLMMKNILNIGVLIVLIQSVTWLGKEENSEKISEYFILLLSTLTGMSYMISSGHFLMLYLGVELATIPPWIVTGIIQPKQVSNSLCRRLCLQGFYYLVYP
jgi:NADH-quinone oxidoreductase subunit N